MLVAGLVLLAAGCGSATATDGPSGARDANRAQSGSAAVEAAGDPANEICSPMIKNDVAHQVTTGPMTRRPSRSKNGDETTCRYTFAGGSLLMTVHESSSDSEAHSYFDELRQQAEDAVRVPNLGSGGFVRPNGATVTVKDDKVLTVDASRLPAGNDKQQIAQSVAFEVLTCWTG